MVLGSATSATACELFRGSDGADQPRPFRRSGDACIFDGAERQRFSAGTKWVGTPPIASLHASLVPWKACARI
jgi:hypothetical protein